MKFIHHMLSYLCQTNQHEQGVTRRLLPCLHLTMTSNVSVFKGHADDEILNSSSSHDTSRSQMCTVRINDLIPRHILKLKIFPSCMLDIVGARFHCAICDFIDICSNCESAGLPGNLDSDDGGHNSSHIMIKVSFAGFVNNLESSNYFRFLSHSKHLKCKQ